MGGGGRGRREREREGQRRRAGLLSRQRRVQCGEKRDERARKAGSKGARGREEQQPALIK